jgi:hypothetical protein
MATHRSIIVTLPSGKQIEVYYFDEALPKDPDPNDLHVCQGCGCDEVEPVAWAEHGPSDWWIRLRCPECLVTRENVFPEELVERYDRHLDARDAKKQYGLRVEEIDSFSAALRSGQIQPHDFLTKNPR